MIDMQIVLFLLAKSSFFFTFNYFIQKVDLEMPGTQHQIYFYPRFISVNISGADIFCKKKT